MIRLSIALFSALFLLAFAGPVLADDDHATVLDSSGSIVRNSTGNCVRTQWMGAGDPCAPAEAPPPPQTMPPRQAYMAPMPRPAPQPMSRTVISDAARTIYFPFNKADLTPKTKAQLDTLASTLKSAHDIEAAKVVGAADRIGGTKYNNELSEKRAKAVRDYLIARGYANASVTKTSWVGKSEPVAKCSKKMPHKKQVACLQADRRVKIDIVYKKEVVTMPASAPAVRAPASATSPRG